MLEPGFEIYTATSPIPKEDVSIANLNTDTAKVEHIVPYFIYRYEGEGRWVYKNLIRANSQWTQAIVNEQEFYDNNGRLLKKTLINTEKLIKAFLTDVLYETVISEQEYLTKYGTSQLYGE